MFIRVLLSLVVALISGLFIAIVLVTPASDSRFLDLERSIGMAFFVVPFTLFGTFAVVWPTYSLARRMLNGAGINLAVIATSTIAGAAMLVGLSQDFPEALLGGFAGGLTSVVWLLIARRFSPGGIDV
ncbi:hypothetical protein [Altererythrobacter aquiaggeris]|uniref:hypothetical protein n=1 Tax=Aestuarierythrobacter aquiaggeris TaxID=1898396 RepID=UPI003018D1D4